MRIIIDPPGRPAMTLPNDPAKHDSLLEWLAILTLSLLLLVMLLIYIPNSLAKPPEETLPENLPMVYEFPLGDFSAMQHQGIGADTTHVISFEAHARVDGKVADLIRFDAHLANYKSRMSEVIDLTIREATPEELQQIELKELKKRLKSRLNELVGEDIIDDVLMSNYRSFTMPKTL